MAGSTLPHPGWSEGLLAIRDDLIAPLVQTRGRVPMTNKRFELTDAERVRLQTRLERLERGLGLRDAQEVIGPARSTSSSRR